MTYMNLIYLGVITSRVPIIPMFIPSHVQGADPVPFGDVFDVQRFIDESGTDIVEWREVKNPDSEVVDDLGCWNIWEVTNAYEPNPRWSFVPLRLNLGKPLPLPAVCCGVLSSSCRYFVHPGPGVGENHPQLRSQQDGFVLAVSKTRIS